MKYYSLKNLLKIKDASFYIVFGERSNGKTHAIQDYALQEYLKTGNQLAVVRRWQEDFRGKRGATYFDSLVCDGNGINKVKKYTKGRYDRIVYQSQRWYLAYWDEDLQKTITDENWFAASFSISSMEREKGNSFPGIYTIFFDEFMTRQNYIPDEFILFCNIISTVFRGRGVKDGCKVFMAANTVSKYCPYFKEMGLNHAKDMKQGTIDVYTYGDSDMKVAVEYAEHNAQGKSSDSFFAFDNPRLKMITQGSFEMAIYPHLTLEYERKDILFTYFVMFDDTILQCEIILKDNAIFTYVHLKTTEIKDDNEDVIFNLEPNEKHNYYKNILKPTDNLSKKIYTFFMNEKVFYQSNDIGEIMNSYLLQCRKFMLK